MKAQEGSVSFHQGLLGEQHRAVAGNKCITDCQHSWHMFLCVRVARGVGRGTTMAIVAQGRVDESLIVRIRPGLPETFTVPFMQSGLRCGPKLLRFIFLVFKYVLKTISTRNYERITINVKNKKFFKFLCHFKTHCSSTNYMKQMSQLLL